MKTYLFTLTLIALLPFAGQAQDATMCGSDAARQKLISEHPEALQYEAELEQFTRNFAANYQHFTANRNGNIVIPVVFHVVHQNGDGNISDAQVLDQMRILNEDYNKRNADTTQVIPGFKPLIADVGIEFRLANLDPNGNPTTGIERINSCQTYMGNDYSKYNTWPREKYLNIWTVKSMRDGVAGYAYYPGSVQAIYNTPAMDGIIILSNYIGAIGTGSYGLARALTHEIGHYLNLKHPWGDNNEPGVSCGDDDVDDTPETRGSTSCVLGLNYCNPGVVENVQNYMDYSYCSRMFTEGQKVRMLAALNSNKSDRDNLWSAANLAATGTDDTSRTMSAAIADFTATRRYICLGQSVKFPHACYNGPVTEYRWEFPNGNPSFSTDSAPTVTFLTTGWQPVKLTITGPLGTSVKQNDSLVYVASDIASNFAPFTQDFEDPNALRNGDWVAINYDGNNTEFVRTSLAGHNSSGGSALLNNYFARADRDIDEIVSPGYDLSGLSNSQLSLSFYYSWATSSQNNSLNPPDSIEVLATSNCNQTSWVNIYKSGSLRALNAGAVTGYFVPTTAQAWWKYIKINLSPNVWKKSNVHFKFRVYGSTKGNNFYIDDINIGAIATGIEAELSAINSATIFPNPTQGDATLNLSLAAAGKVQVTLLDLTGKQIATVYDGQLNDGETLIPINNSAALAAGVYVVNIKAGESVLQKKLVVN